MKTYQAVEIGNFCGLERLFECIENVEYHYSNLFSRLSLTAQMSELYDDPEYTEEDITIDEWVKENNYEWYYKNEEAEQYEFMSLRKKLLN